MSFKKVLVDIEAVIDLPCPSWMFGHDLEKQASYLEDEAKELTDFLHDHRSRDGYRIEIRRSYESRCSFCGSLEDRDTGGSPCCCQKAIDEFDQQKNIKANITS